MAAPLLLAAATSVWLLPIVDHRSFSCASSSDSTAACSPPPSQRPPSLHRAKRTAASLHRPKRTAAPHACAARSELNDEASSLATASRDGLLWDGPSPAPHLEPRTVVALVLGALQRNDTPVRHSGTAHLRRFCTPSFELAGIPDDAPPQQLSALFSEPNSQYGLFLDSTVAFTYPSDVFDLGDKAFQDVALEATVGTSWGRPGQVLAKLGFEKYGKMIEEQHAKFVEAEEKFEALMKEKGKEFISGDNLKTMGKLKRKLARFAKKHIPLCGGFATGFSLAMASFP